jgi:hypothetical protein
MIEEVDQNSLVVADTQKVQILVSYVDASRQDTLTARLGGKVTKVHDGPVERQKNTERAACYRVFFKRSP